MKRPEEDEDGFRALVQQEWVSLTRTAFLLTGDRDYAEDLVQAALEKTHRRWGSVAHLDSPRAYVRRVMINTATSWRRRRSFGELPQEPTEAVYLPGGFEQVEQRQQLLAALQLLPPKMRAVLVLSYFEDLPDQQIAEAMGSSVATVKSQRSRGLGRLREQIGVSPLFDTAVQEG
ncbi:SigE family RNA polymerase sigma factor [Kineosporia babensis]|uniref:SigE family RNA polymerase sigma factor n=1 Tax=Kineosporia babensis TaxID=499548 RepID=A0A9X1NJP1_9ACTN|nr:SigE family RNA polymerase sigma factor [Kineosporia babensis]MCD5314373.1 SigE family RNA polymerase sigma factor [Kineosporia babensis]